jgi:hypothetical protein
VVFDDGREMGTVAPLGTRPARLLATGPPRSSLGRGCERGRRFGRGSGLGLSAEQLLLAEAKQGLEPLDLSLELGLAFEAAAMHGLPVGCLPPGFELLLQAWANQTGTLRDGRSGANGTERRLGRRQRRSESVQFRGRDPQGNEAKNTEAEPSSMVAEFNHLLSGRPEPTTGLPNLPTDSTQLLGASGHRGRPGGHPRDRSVFFFHH